MAGEQTTQNPNIKTYTADDMFMLRDFVAALRNRLQLLTEEADAKAPKGTVTYPLSPIKVESLIRTDPELRMRWKQLSKTQQSYAHNRYVINTPTRYETMDAFAVNPFASPLEHDYHATTNPGTYRTGRVATTGVVSTLDDSVTGVVSGMVKPVVEPLFRPLMGDKYVEVPSSIVDKSIKDKKLRDQQAKHNRTSQEALRRLRSGGYSQFGKDSANEAVEQPLESSQRAAESFTKTAAPLVADYWIGKGIAGSGQMAAAATAGKATRAAKALHTAAKGVEWGGNAMSAWGNPFDILRHPVTSGKTVWKGLNGLWRFRKFIRNPKNVIRIVSSNRNSLRAAKAGLTAAGRAANGAFTAAGGLVDAVHMYEGAADVHNAMRTPEQGVALSPKAANRAYISRLVGRQPTDPQTERRSFLQDRLHKMTNGSTDWHWGAAAAGGGLLGMLLGGKNRLAGGILGALLGAGGLAAYNYYKNKDI